MCEQLELFTTRFNHNDFLYEDWYDRQAELCEDESGFSCDTIKVRTVFAKSVIDWINGELKTNIQFESMYFPREYNFECDAINVKFSKHDFQLIDNWFAENKLYEKLDELVDSYTTTISGYIPFHSKDTVMNDYGLLMGIMLELFNNEQHSEFEQYYDCQCIYDDLANCEFN